MKEFFVYLCGPMAALSPRDANNWRLRALEAFQPAGITVVSPMREKDMLEQGTVMGVDYKMYGEVPELRAQSIYSRDTYDISHANIILANMTDIAVITDEEGIDHEIPSVGSDWEMGYSAALGTPIVLVAPERSYYRKHPFPIAGASITFDLIDQGIDWIIRNFRPYHDRVPVAVQEEYDRRLRGAAL